MAVVFSNKLDYTNILVIVYIMLGESFITLSSAKFEDDQLKRLRFQSVSQPTITPPQVRLHPGVVTSVVIVTIAAVVAAAFIIRKYCFPQSDATYRYSALRQMEEQDAVVVEDESDEDLLE